MCRCLGHTKRAFKGPQQNFECDSITAEQRVSIFNQFWQMKSWDSRKIFVKTLVTSSTPKYRRKAVDDNKPKNNSFTYHLKLQVQGKDKTFHVCKKMFTSTLGIGDRTVRSWLVETNNNEDVQQSEQPPTEVIANNSGTKSARDFLNSLPKLESHYCRASTSKLYLEPVWDSLRQLFREFEDYCQQNNKQGCGWRSFYLTFKKMNLALYSPKKDQCNKCLLFQRGKVSIDEYNTHQSRKNDARIEKDTDKMLADSANCNVSVYTVDMQAVLLAPRLRASANYYKTKLKVHNYTIYNLNDRDVDCFVWHEANGGLESEVFATILVKFLKEEIEKRRPSKIIVWSDGCCYQNKNTKLSNALLELAMRTNVVIEQKYLEVGHTQMEVDAVHSMIERKLGRNKEMFVPADYIHVMKSARETPAPFNVRFLSYDYFENFTDWKYSSVRPGNKSGDPCVNDVCAFQYEPNGIINYKLGHTDEWKALPRRPKTGNLPSHPRLYTQPLEIELSKFIHLQELKSLLPGDHQPFYNLLKHKTCTGIECPHLINS